MAEDSISVDQDRFICPVCLDLLKDPVTVPCGHSFCMVCINGCRNLKENRGVYRCPQCRHTFSPRTVLCRNIILAEVVEKVKTEGQAASAHCYAGPGDVECDFCTGRKRKAIKSCLVCVASSCETHLKPHLEGPALKRHKLVEASKNLQDKICSQHDEVLKIYCRTDQICICSLCMLDKHKGHDAVLVAAGRSEKQRELKEEQKKSQQRIQEKQKKVQELKQAMYTIKLSAQAAVEDIERIFTEMISSIEKRRSEVTELIRAQVKAGLSQAEQLQEQLEQEIADLQRRVTELEALAHTHDDLHFLQEIKRELKEEQKKSQQRIQEKQKKVQELKQAMNTIKLSAQAAVEDIERRIFTEMISSIEKRHSEVTELIRAQVKAGLSQAEKLQEQLEQEIADLQRRVTELEALAHTHDDLHFLQEIKVLVPGRRSPETTRPEFESDLREDSHSITVNQHLSFDGVMNSLSAVNKSLEEFCQKELIKIPEHVEDAQILLSEPKSRDEFLKYFCDLTLDPNTVNNHLILSEKNRAVTYSGREQKYSDHPERFDTYPQVLSKESVCGRCYWEVDWSGSGVHISVSYKDIRRKGCGDECLFGHNNQSWSLHCIYYSLFFHHNNIRTLLSVPSSSRIGVYVDHSAGTLSFYSVSDTMKLLHRVHTTFTQPLYAGFRLNWHRATK